MLPLCRSPQQQHKPLKCMKRIHTKNGLFDTRSQIVVLLYPHTPESYVNDIVILIFEPAIIHEVAEMNIKPGPVKSRPTVYSQIKITAVELVPG